LSANKKLVKAALDCYFWQFAGWLFSITFSRHVNGKEAQMHRTFNHGLAITLLLLFAISVGLPVGVAAADKQDQAKACNDVAEKKGLQGNDRKNFVQDCLNKASNTKPISDMSQKDKLNACQNLADKRNLQGSDRRSFIKDCMNKATPK
jgi:hypothetical protein